MLAITDIILRSLHVYFFIRAYKYILRAVKVSEVNNNSFLYKQMQISTIFDHIPLYSCYNFFYFIIYILLF